MIEMGNFIILFLVYFFVAFISFNMFNISKKIQTILLILPLFLFTSLRNVNVGNDTYNYYFAFNFLSNQALFEDSISRFEPGYVLLNKLVASLGLEYFELQIFIAVLFYISLIRFLYKYSPSIPVSVLTFISLHFFFQTMNVSRQFIAVGVLFFAFDYLIKKKLIGFIFTVFLASLFHSSAWFFLLTYPFMKIKITKNNFVFFITALLLMSFMFNPILNIFFKYFDKYNHYIGSIYFNNEGNIAVYLNLLIYLSVFILIKYVGSQLHNLSESEIKIWRINESISLLAVILGVLALNAPLINRVAMYFTIYYILIIPYTIIQIKNNKLLREGVYLSVIIAMAVYYITIIIYRPYWTGIIPYEFYNQ